MEQQEVVETIKIGRIKLSEKMPPESHRDYLDMDTDEEEFGHQGTTCFMSYTYYNVFHLFYSEIILVCILLIVLDLEKAMRTNNV